MKTIHTTKGITKAEEFLDKSTNSHAGAKIHKISGSGFIHFSDIPEIMIEFAKLHVEAALEAASEKLNEERLGIDNHHIINAYPKENIK